MYHLILQQAEHYRAAIIDLAQQLIRTPSPSGSEASVAHIVADRLNRLGYSSVERDAAGNVYGNMLGEDQGSQILMLSHLDHLPPGDHENWKHDPYAGVIEDGFLHGRGASDGKGAIAAQVFAGKILQDLGLLKRGTYHFASVVQRESATSFGVRYLFEQTFQRLGLSCDLVVLGDPTGLDISLGHRGRLEMEVTTYGRTSHAASPWLGVNAIAKMTPVIDQIQGLGETLPVHPLLGKSTIAVTSIDCKPNKYSVVPDRCAISIDRRFLPSEPLDEVIGQIQAILNRLSSEDPTFKAMVHVRRSRETSYAGHQQEVMRLLLPFLSSPQHPLVAKLAIALEKTQQSVGFGKWNFHTNGSYTAGVRGIATVGYSPGETKYYRTPFDRLDLDALVKATAGYAAMFYHCNEESDHDA